MVANIRLALERYFLTHNPSDRIGPDEVLAAMEEIPRAEFLPTDSRSEAYENKIIPFYIGDGIASASQPSAIASMLIHLQLWKGANVLEIGTGTGWPTALVHKLVGEFGRVHTIEIDPGRAAFAQDNLERYLDGGNNSANIFYYVGDGRKLLPNDFFSHIYFTAAASISDPHIGMRASQLLGGRLVFPEKNLCSLVVLERELGHAYMPLVEEQP
jgi:protein-L-isoaspartate(D-aspartate) O-methyltransferase